ncbi:MAG: hypothetical protein UU48_C0011G0017 [Candidatus Uhrbacteria bacterium GW2011_GWF2_41_16]|nr:MAG: hypothetical protein UU31_C0004G0016 [Candidatus Uhrbacteria bacterium GW2011_GWA2_41_10]KKR97625.1 MAG: hypothetical protein UU48_C0011G0017 [Candidatus Uhrbacteria bacterium GW2011_GWF2_41_16]
MVLGVILFGVWILFLGTRLGQAVAPEEKGVIGRICGIWTLLSGVALAGTFVFYLWIFSEPVAIFLSLLAMPVVWFVLKRVPKSSVHEAIRGKYHHIPPAVLAAITVMIAWVILAFLLVLPTATEEAIRSPWEQIPSAVFFVFAGAALILISLLFRGRERTLTLFLSSLFLFLMISVVLFVYPLGYGFDQFIHQATEEHIAAFGTIQPKPFYYIGQYTLVLFLHHAFFFPLELTDRFLLPVLVAFLLPAAWYAAAVHLFQEKRHAIASLPWLFFLPLSSFIATTPQGMANLWILMIILTALPRLLGKESWPLWPSVIGTAATLAIHPIAGIPAALFLILVAADSKNPSQRFPTITRLLFWTTVAVGSVILPLSFLANAAWSHQEISFNLSSFFSPQWWQGLPLPVLLENRFAPLLDGASFFLHNQFLLLFLAGAAGWWFADKNTRSKLKPYAFVSGMLITNYFLMKTVVQFTFLIDYERGNYAERLLPLSVFFLSPFLMIAGEKMISFLREKPFILRVSLAGLLALCLTAAWYGTYPRQDAYTSSHGYNVSRTDLDTVLDIEKNASGQAYIVLANQTVSAAAVREWGFKRYYDDIFFYPIPTGGDLYQIFLSMNNEPDTKKAEDAIRLTGVSVCYFVVNDYWWQAPRIIETAKTVANDWWSMGDGSVYIFKFEMTK